MVDRVSQVDNDLDDLLLCSSITISASDQNRMNFRDSDTQYFHGVLGRQRVGWRSNPRFRVFSSALLRLSYRPVMCIETFQSRKQPDVLRHRAVKRHSLPYLVSFAQRTLKHGRIRMDSMLLIGVRGLLKSVMHVL